MLISLRRALMRVRITEVLKFVVAAALGFTLRVMQETSQSSTSCPSACASSHIALPAPDLNALGDQLREPYKPLSAADVIEYRFVNLTHVYDSHGSKPQTLLKKYHHGDLKELLLHTRNYFTSEERRFLFRSLRSAYERIDPLRGKEYVLDLEMESPAAHRPGLSVRESYRVSLVKPFSATQLLRRKHVAKLPPGQLTIVVAMHLDQLPAFHRFLSIYENFVTRGGWGAALRFVVFRPTDSPQLDKALTELRKALEEARSRTKDPKTAHIDLRLINAAPFRPHKARHAAIKDLPDHAGLILTDLNVNLTGDFYFRCEATIQSDQRTIYAPIPFSLFRMTDMSRVVPNRIPRIDSDTGYWDHDNLQTFCLKKSAYDDAGAYDILDDKRDEWSENAALYARFVKLKFAIIRSVDPAVFVSYHEQTCQRWVDLGYMTANKCKELTAKSIGSRTMLAQQRLP